jgi:hypothetical protein
MIIVSSLLVLSFMVYANTMRFSSEVRQMKNLLDYVSAKGAELVTLAIVANATTENFVQMPATIGNKQYWLRLRNDSESAWIEGGFGDIATEPTDIRVHLPSETIAMGYYVGGGGTALLNCSLTSELPQLLLTNSNVGD